MADPVNFTRPAAERIAKVVRAVEYGNRDSTGPSFDRSWYGDPSIPLRLGTFTGNWETAQYTTVTLHGSTQTASVYNWCNPALGANTSSTTESRYVIFGKVKGTNSAVEIQMRSTQCTATLVLGTLDLKTLPGFEAGVIQLLGHAAGSTASTCSGGLHWYSIATCSTASSNSGGGGEGGSSNNNDDPPAANTPSEPQGFQVVDVELISGTGGYMMQWSAPSSDGGSAVTSYVVEYNVAGVGNASCAGVSLPSDLDPDWTVATPTDCTTSGYKKVSIGGINTFDVVWFRASAVNANGRGLYAYTSMCLFNTGGDASCP